MQNVAFQTAISEIIQRTASEKDIDVQSLDKLQTLLGPLEKALSGQDSLLKAGVLLSVERKTKLDFI